MTRSSGRRPLSLQEIKPRTYQINSCGKMRSYFFLSVLYHFHSLLLIPGEPITVLGTDVQELLVICQSEILFVRLGWEEQPLSNAYEILDIKPTRLCLKSKLMSLCFPLETINKAKQHHIKTVRQNQ